MIASGLPSLVPVLNIPIAAADTVVLTKNQAMMVYRLALAFGAPPEFQRRMIEITPVIGAAVMWRQVAGGLVGLIPGYGIVPKTAVAFAGTWVTGRAAELYYSTGLRLQGRPAALLRGGHGPCQGHGRGDGAPRPPGARRRAARGEHDLACATGTGKLRAGAGKLVPRRRIPEGPPAAKAGRPPAVTPTTPAGLPPGSGAPARPAASAAPPPKQE